MSDYDPNRMDPKRPAVNEAGYAANRGFNWSWVIGGVAVVVVLIIALSFMGGDDRTADTAQPPAATTGQSTPSTAPAPSTPPASSTAPAPSTPNAVPADRTAPSGPANPKQ
ncbi:MAG: hypothetical protein AB7V13_04630 [Pseudorhodoplanes sp.]|uniref:hypothetical protein n=1 Tax=Pseudorhodoplanes sp. TaxID=1934341 RepID=UPI003D0B15E5